MRLAYCVLVGLFLFSLPALAADPSEAEKNQPLSTGAVNCFDYYHFGSVQVDLNPTLEQSVPGETLEFQGIIKNENDYPILDGSVYVKIFKRSEKNLDAVFDNAYPLMDQFMLPETFILPAQGERSASFSWTIPANAEGGEYFAAFFFQSAKHYNLLGLSFTDDVTGNTAQFFVSGTEDTDLVAFNKNTVTLNGKVHRFANFPLQFKQDETVTAAIEITNPKSEPAAVSLIWKNFNWDGLRDENLRETRTEIIELGAGETKTVKYDVLPTDTTVSYLVLEMRDGQSKSFLDIRLVRDGNAEINVNFPSILNYPLRSGVENGIFACIHSTNVPVIPNNALTLTLKDMEGNVIHSYQYRGDVTGDMMGFADRFTPTQTYTDFTLTTTLEREGRVFEDTTQTYRCQDIDPSLCPEAATVVSQDQSNDRLKTTGMVVVGVTVFLGLLAILVVAWKKRRGMTVFFWISLLFCGLGMGVQAEAKSVDQSININWGGEIVEGIGGGSQAGGNIALTVKYEGTVKLADGTVIADNDTVTVGQTIKFRRVLEGEYTSAAWFPTGHSDASPFARWYDSQALLEASRNAGMVKIIRPLVSMQHNGTAGLDCSGGQNVPAFWIDCRVTSAGTIRSKMIFASTRLHAMSDYYNISSKTISFSFKAVQPNRPPANPTLTGPASGNEGQVRTFSARSRDPDGDDVRYQFDWNNDNAGDTWAPVGGEWLDSNVSGSRGHAWNRSGNYIIQVRAKDDQGNYSGWTQKTVRIIDEVNGECGVASTDVGGTRFLSAPQAGFCTRGTRSALAGNGPWTWTCNGSGGGDNDSCRADLAIPDPVITLRANPLTIDLGDESTLTWSVANSEDVTCRASGGWGGKREISDSTEVSPVQSTMYTLRCTNSLTGGFDIASVSVALNNYLKICENSCSSLRKRSGTTFSMDRNSTRNLKACYNQQSGCQASVPVGDVTALADWNDTNQPDNVVSLPSAGTVRSGGDVGDEKVDVRYSGQTATTTAIVFCNISRDCDSSDVRAVRDLYCPDVEQDTGFDNGCGDRVICSGTRSCNTNLQEIAP